MIVLEEHSTEPKNDFEDISVTRWRVYKKDGNKVFLHVWRQAENENVITSESSILLDLPEIPVAIVGSLDAQPPLLDLANLNILHYQKKSNFDHLEMLAAVPLFFTKGLELSEGDEQVTVGANIHYQLPESGDIGWSQIDSNGFASLRDSIKQIEEEMQSIGLSMLKSSDKITPTTATEAIFSNLTETSQLRVMASNLLDAIELSLMHTCSFLGIPREQGGSIKLGAIWNRNADKFTTDLETLSLKADIALKLDGLVSREWLIEFLASGDSEQAAEILSQIEKERSILPEDLDPIEE